MILTTQQAADKIGCSKATVAKLVRDGKLQSVNKAEPGKRVAHRFDSKVILEFKRTLGETGIIKPRKTNGHSMPTTPGQISQRLASIESKLDTLAATLAQLMQLWA